MRVSCVTFIFLAWMGATTLSAELHATTMLPGEPITAQQAVDDGHADTERTVAIWDQAAAWVWSKQREFHRAVIAHRSPLWTLAAGGVSAWRRPAIAFRTVAAERVVCAETDNGFVNYAHWLGCSY